ARGRRRRDGERDRVDCRRPSPTGPHDLHGQNRAQSGEAPYPRRRRRPSAQRERERDRRRGGGTRSRTMRLRAGIVVTAALAALIAPGRGESKSATADATRMTTAAPSADGPPQRSPLRVVAGTREVRAVAVCSGGAWVASRGGVERFALGSWERRGYAVADGL